MKAMIFAAGLGSRLKPFTNDHPKALAIINGKPLLQRAIEYLQRFGIKAVVVNVHHFADQIIDVIEANKGWNSSIEISNETEMVLETGGGLKKAAPLFAEGENIVVMNADILTDLNLSAMLQQHLKTKALVTLAVTDRATSRYFLFDEENRLCGWRNSKTGEEKISINKQTLHPLAFSGVHIINTRIFPLMQQEGKFSIVDTYLKLADTQLIQAFNHSGGKLIDVGKPESIAAAETLFV